MEGQPWAYPVPPEHIGPQRPHHRVPIASGYCRAAPSASGRAVLRHAHLNAGWPMTSGHGAIFRAVRQLRRRRARAWGGCEPRAASIRLGGSVRAGLPAPGPGLGHPGYMADLSSSGWLARARLHWARRWASRECGDDGQPSLLRGHAGGGHSKRKSASKSRAAPATGDDTPTPTVSRNRLGQSRDSMERSALPTSPRSSGGSRVRSDGSNMTELGRWARLGWAGLRASMRFDGTPLHSVAALCGRWCGGGSAVLGVERRGKQEIP